jgi:hypothetical protein
LSRTYISFARIGAHTTEGKSQMTKMKTLGAMIILSAAVATPVFAQDAGVRGPGSRYGLESQRGPTYHGRNRGAYNQLNGPFDAIPRTRDGWTGGEDPSLHPASS